MQVKLLNLHKLLSNIATNLVGAFIPLIVYNATGKLLYGIIAYALQYVVRTIVNFIFKNLFLNKPQLSLVYRIIPIILYSVSILLIDSYLWVGIVGAVFFYGVSEAFKNLPKEVIYNYSTLENAGDGIGLTRLFEQIGTLAAFIVGGYILDISKVTVIIISLSIYAVSCIPLLVYYFKSVNQVGFNKDFTSNAREASKKNEKRFNQGVKVGKKIITSYMITYFLYCFVDALTTAYMLLIMVKGQGNYSQAGIFTAVYNGAYGIGAYLFGILFDKKDTTGWVIACSLIMAGGVMGIAFAQNVYLLYVLFAVVGFAYGLLPLFMLQNLLAKIRILGMSNRALVEREYACGMSVAVAILFGSFGTLLPVFIAISSALAITAYRIPYNESKTRRLLVNYLQNNEIIQEEKKVFIHKR